MNTTLSNQIIAKAALALLARNLPLSERKPPNEWVDIEISYDDCFITLREFEQRFLEPAINTLLQKLSARPSGNFYVIEVPAGVPSSVQVFGRVSAGVIQLHPNGDKLTFRIAVAYY
jgi:hypothetical protein